MKNIMVANFFDNRDAGRKVQKHDILMLHVESQILNSLQFGWKPEDIILVSNKDFEFQGVKSTVFQLNQICATGSKMFGIRALLESGMLKEECWMHDLDAWQNCEFPTLPEFKDAGFCRYMRSTLNGGNAFWKPSGIDIVQDICNYILSNSMAKEEPAINKIIKEKYSSRVTEINSTYNVGCTGFVKRIDRAEKPIHVFHFGVTNATAWDTHTRNRNGMSKVYMSDKLKNLLIKQYGHIVKNYNFTDGTGPFELRTVDKYGKTIQYET
jgi:hypothetical protein